MTILENGVYINISSKNIKYYSELGYENLKVGNREFIKIYDLPHGSNAKVTKICDYEECDVEGGRKIPNQTYSNIVRNRARNGTGLDFCAKCKVKYYWKTYKCNIPYEKSLHYYSITHNKMHIIEDFVGDEDELKLIMMSSLDKYYWRCPKCKSEYKTTASMKSNSDVRCPYCHGKRVNETNCIWTTNPELAKLLADPDDGYKYTKGSKVKIDWKCSNCNNIVKNKSILNVYNKGLKCLSCNDNISFGEKIVYSLLNQTNMEFEYQISFEWSNKKKYDFYIPSLNTIIEVHGEQHYNGSFKKMGGRSLEEEQENDKYKREVAIKNNIINYVEIDARESDENYILDSLLNSKLINLINLESIDWNKCIIESQKSLMIKSCELFNQGFSSGEICKELKLSKTPILKYLKKGTQLGWCNYNAKEARHKSNSKKNKCHYK